MSFVTFPLDVSHRKEEFNCGKPLLDNYLHKQAKQDVKRRLAACFVLSDGGSIKAYYTLSAAAIERRLLPQDIIKKLPPTYNDLPAILLGRLAVDTRYQGQGLGEMTLLDALKRSYLTSNEVGSMAVMVDPLDEPAANFYGYFNFHFLPDSGKMFLPMAAIAQLFPEA